MTRQVFTTSPSWFTTARFLGHMLLPTLISSPEFEALDWREKKEYTVMIFLFRLMLGMALVMAVLLSGVMLTTSVFGAVIVFFATFGVIPVTMVTVLWLTMKTIVEPEASGDDR